MSTAGIVAGGLASAIGGAVLGLLAAEGVGSAQNLHLVASLVGAVGGSLIGWMLIRPCRPGRRPTP